MLTSIMDGRKNRVYRCHLRALGRFKAAKLDIVPSQLGCLQHSQRTSLLSLDQGLLGTVFSRFPQVYPVLDQTGVLARELLFKTMAAVLASILREGAIL